jgi:thiosulfate/3-mercaptopyruvate sulfurtransferase
MKTASQTTAPNKAPAKDGDVLVSPAWLAEHLSDSAVRIVEVDVSPASYDEWHIDGAVLWNIYQDLKDADYRLIDADSLERLIARSGISPDSTVVFYGYAPAMGFWLMKLHGHADARILDASRGAWQASGLPRSTSAARPATAGYRLGDADAGIRAGLPAVRDAAGQSSATIADVRSAEEYRGERFWPSGGLEPNGRAGHVPSAVHLPIDGLYDEHGSFRPAADLSGIFSAIDLHGDDDVITYCTIGGRACTAWFVLTYLLGRERVRVYDGSWAEWGREAGTPVQQT